MSNSEAFNFFYCIKDLSFIKASRIRKCAHTGYLFYIAHLQEDAHKEGTILQAKLKIEICSGIKGPIFSLKIICPASLKLINGSWMKFWARISTSSESLKRRIQSLNPCGLCGFEVLLAVPVGLGEFAFDLAFCQSGLMAVRLLDIFPNLFPHFFKK